MTANQYFTNELVHHLLEEIKDYAIFMIDLEGKIVTWNPGVQRLLGYSEDSFIAQPFANLFTEADRQVNIPEAELKNALEKGRAEDERWHQKKDGSVFWASGLVTVIKNEQGFSTGFAKIMRDQTQKKQFEEEIAKNVNLLSVANKELKNFAQLVSHDLNAPLQTMYGFANLLKDQAKLEPEAEESLEYIVDGAQRMINLVHELLDYSTQENQELDVILVDSATLVGEVLRNLTARIKAKDATVAVEGAPQVWADPTQLSRVLQNLIENAIKYTPANRTPAIQVIAEEKGDDVVFEIRDNGRGMTSEEASKLFTLFERLHPEEDIPGKGIGLATCKKIIERMDGKIWVTSKENEGSSFFFSLPQHPKSVESPAISPSLPTPTHA